MRALLHANEVRHQRAELKRALRSREASVADLLIDPPDFLLSATLFEIVLAVPGYGEVRTGRLLKRCRISPLKTIAGLSRRQRQELAAMLRTI